MTTLRSIDSCDQHAGDRDDAKLAAPSHARNATRVQRFAAAYYRALAELHEGRSSSSTTKLQAITDAHRECSEAVNAALQGTSRGSNVSREEQLREVREAEAALGRLRAAIEAAP